MREVVCIASGPSLAESDCALVRHWRGQDDGRGVVVTNTTFRMCPWADALYGMDNEWWRVYGDEVADVFEGTCYSRFGNYGTFRVNDHGHNSGAGAILLAAALGAERIILLGYDCSVENGKHWHPDHRRPLKNCESVGRWPEHFREAKAKLDGVDIVNASRSTALDVFPVATLESVL